MTLRVGTRRTRLANRAAPLAVAPGQSALYQSLVAFWALDETSGNRADGIGSNTLTDNNTVGSNTGLVYATAADFEADNSEYLSIANNAAVSMGDIDFWVAAWVKFESGGDDRSVIRKGSDTREYGLHRQTTGGRARFYVSSAGNNEAGAIVATTFGALSNGTWYLLVGYHDATNNVVGISVNGGTPDTTAYSAGVVTSSSAFHLGRFGEFSTTYMDGLMGPVMLGKGYIPNASDLTFLYNAGAGRTLDAMYAYAG